MTKATEFFGLVRSYYECLVCKGKGSVIENCNNSKEKYTYKTCEQCNGNGERYSDRFISAKVGRDKSTLELEYPVNYNNIVKGQLDKLIQDRNKIDLEIAELNNKLYMADDEIK